VDPVPGAGHSERKPRKPIAWLGPSLDDIREFPEDARREAGHQLNRLQEGLLPEDWKPMPTVGPGVAELWIRTGRSHRVFYLAKFDEAVYVLHAFEKKSQKTADLDVEIGQRRFKELVALRRRLKER